MPPKIPFATVLTRTTEDQQAQIFRHWGKIVLSLNDDAAYDANNIIRILKYNQLDVMSNFLAIRDEDLQAIVKPNPNAGGDDIPIGVVERKIIQSLVCYYHQVSTKNGVLTYPDDAGWNPADYLQLRISSETAIVPFGSGHSKDEKEALEFNKKTKISYSDYNKLTEESLFRKQSEHFLAIAVAHGMSDCFEDPDTFKPSNIAVDKLKQSWMYSNLLKNCTIPIAKTVLNDYKKTKDVRRIWKILSDKITHNRAAEIRESNLASFLTSTRFEKQGWRGTQANQVLHYHVQMKTYSEVAKTDWADEQKVMLTANAVSGVPNLSVVIETLKNARIGSNALGYHQVTIYYSEYHESLYSAAQAYDAGQGTTPRTRRANVHDFALEDALQDSVNDYEANVHDVDTDFMIFSQANVNETTTLATQSDTTKKLRLFIPKETWNKMNRKQQLSWASLPEHIKKAIVKTAQERQVNVHEFFSESHSPGAQDSSTGDEDVEIVFEGNTHDSLVVHPKPVPDESSDPPATLVDNNNDNELDKEKRVVFNLDTIKRGVTEAEFAGLDISAMMADSHQDKPKDTRPRPVVQAKFHEINMDEELNDEDNDQPSLHSTAFSYHVNAHYIKNDEQDGGNIGVESSSTPLPSFSTTTTGQPMGTLNQQDDDDNTVESVKDDAGIVDVSAFLANMQDDDTTFDPSVNIAGSKSVPQEPKDETIDDIIQRLSKSSAPVQMPPPSSPLEDVEVEQPGSTKDRNVASMFAELNDEQIAPIPKTPVEEQSMLDEAIASSQEEATDSSYLSKLIKANFRDLEETMDYPFKGVLKPPKTIDRIVPKKDKSGLEFVKRDPIEEQSLAKLFPSEGDARSPMADSAVFKTFESARRRLNPEQPKPYPDEVLTSSSEPLLQEQPSSDDVQSLQTRNTPPPTTAVGTPAPPRASHATASKTSPTPTDQTIQEQKSPYSMVAKTDTVDGENPVFNDDTESPPKKFLKTPTPAGKTSSSSNKKKKKKNTMPRSLASLQSDFGANSRIIAPSTNARPRNSLQTLRSPSPDTDGFTRVSHNASTLLQDHEEVSAPDTPSNRFDALKDEEDSDGSIPQSKSTSDDTNPDFHKAEHY